MNHDLASNRRAFAAMLLLISTGTSCERIEDAPPIAGKQEFPAPFPQSVQRGVEGEQDLIGGDWSFHPYAYSARFHQGFEPVTRFRAPRTISRAIRIRVPPGGGPPVVGYSERWGVVEIEARDGPSDSGPNLLIDASARAKPAAGAAALNDGVRVGSWGENAWTSDELPGTSDWVEFRFSADTAWTDLVFHWPLQRMPGPWFKDPEIDGGLTPAAVVVQSWHDGQWRQVEIAEVRHGSRGDGPFARERLGLSLTPRARDAHLDELDRWCALDGAGPTGDADLVEVTGDVVLHTAATEVRHGAEDFRRWMKCAFDREVPVRGATGGGSGTAGTEAVHVTVLTSFPAALRGAVTEEALEKFRERSDRPGSFLIVATDTGLVIVGADAMGARYGLARLIELMTDTGVPAVPRELGVRRPAISPRIMSGISLGRGGPDGLGFSDAYLDLMTRYYLDGIYVFQALPYFEVTSTFGSDIDERLVPEGEKILQLRGLIARAGERGLGVYLCVSLPGVFPPGVYRTYPEIRGDNPAPYVVCLSSPSGRAAVEDGARRIASLLPGLSGLVVLRTEFTHSCGGRARCESCARAHRAVDDPALEMFEWVRDAALEVAPELEVIAMDWRAGGLPAPDVDALPEDVGVWMRPGRLHRRSPENDIRDVVPSDEFRDLVGKHRGARRIWVEDQLTHAFPFHALPELPAADLYWDKWSRLLELGGGELSFGGGNGSGFVPTPMVDLVLRQMFWEPREDRETVLTRVAGRWFGREQAAAVRRAWWTCSQALREHAQMEKYVSRAAYIEPLGLEDSNLTDENAMSLRLLRARWEIAVDEIERAAAAAPKSRRRLATREADFARAARVGVVSLDHAMRAAELTRELRRAGTGSEAIREAILTVTRNEIANVDSAIALASRRPLLRRHPFYRNRFELEPLVEKRRALEGQLGSLETR